MTYNSVLHSLKVRLIFVVRIMVLLALVGTMIAQDTSVSAQGQPDLLTATSFSVLAGTTVINTGPTIIGPPAPAPYLSGSLGVSPGSAIVGFPPGTVLAPGAIHSADAVALQAQNDVVTVYNTLAGEPCPFGNLLPASVGTLTLTPGIYCFTSSALFTMPSSGLTLDLQGDPNALFVFQIPDQLTTQPGYPISFINGAAPCNVWWQIGSSATLDTTTQFVGNILALTSISLANGATVEPGRALAQTGAVTLDTNVINMTGCVPQAVPTATPTNTPTPLPTNTPTPTNTNTPWAAVSLPLTGYPPVNQPAKDKADQPDNWLPIALIGGLFLVTTGAWIQRRRRKLQKTDV